MDCFQDFCLACDSALPTSDTYCSQACRLADLEKATSYGPPAPATPTATSDARLSWSSPTSTASSAYILTPAYDFADKSGPSSPRQLREASRRPDSYFMRSPAEQSQSQPITPKRSITPSSSRSSLSSTGSDGSTGSAGGISQKARAELEAYFNSFSQAKAAKRRPSLR
ncbi:hypothetical protein B0A50_04505 [Salinomyces thailandicus]|uniref:Life-span regulatory factor domain-containing protein n=1 Tax=Salinomyces thailandicus TaxID=706561 RepID=A0A4U0TXL9_9PEZI|nr:hypothetical protein B0A50_04505 [Salinomyces thailandica]